MITFALIAIIMVVAALASILVPLGRDAARGGPASADVNLDVLRGQHRELDQDLVGGAISTAQYLDARRELEERVLVEAHIGAGDPVPGPSPRTPAWMIAVIAVTMPAAAIALYRAVGAPYALDPSVMRMVGMLATTGPDSQWRPAPPAVAAGEVATSVGSGSEAVAAAHARVVGTVTLAPDLQNLVAPDDVVFVIARPAGNARVPLAIQRTQVKHLPFQFQLDDSLAMTAQLKLSDHPSVVIVARVARSGSPMPRTGDLEGLSTAVTVGEHQVAVVIDRKLP